MPTKIVILGGGVGGTLTANLLARRLGKHDVSITVADATGQHVYQPGWLYIPFGQERPRNLVRSERTLLGRRVNLVVDRFTRIDPDRRLVIGEGGTQLPYDFLVLATGSRNSPDDVPGLAEANHHFYSAEAALELGTALEQLDGGRIVVGVGGLPYRCPPAPLEFLLLLDSHLRATHRRDAFELTYTFPLGRPFTIESVAEFVSPILEQRGIAVETFFNVETVDAQAREVTSLEGTTLPFDLLVMVPPHRGAEVISASGLGDEQGWLPTDRQTLLVRGQERIYALGDATNLPVSKSGSAAHFQAQVVVERIIAEITGTPVDKHCYNGHVMCFLETGDSQATSLNFDYDHPPQPPRPSRIYHYEKMLFNKAYWHIVPTGVV